MSGFVWTVAQGPHCPGHRPVQTTAADASMSRGVLMCAAELAGYGAQSVVAPPEAGSLGQGHRCQQTNIDVADAPAAQDMALDESRDFVALGDHGGWQILKQFQDRRTIAQTFAGLLADHERMHDDVRSLQKGQELRSATAKGIDPHRGVDQDRTGLPRRLRGAAVKVGCDPPSRASRLAL
jgi:hypothetical protein